MADFLRTAYKSATGFIENLIDTSDPSDPSSLLPVRSSDKHLNIIDRDDCLILCNVTAQQASQQLCYEIVIMLPISLSSARTSGYSFLRTPELQIAKLHYNSLRDVLAPLIECDDEFWFQYAMLKKLWLFIRENPGANAAHTAAFFDHELSFTTGNTVILSGLSAFDESQLTPIHTAVTYSGIRTLVAVLQHAEHINIKAVDKSGCTILHLAAVGPTDKLLAVVEKCEDILNITTKDGLTPLHLACASEKFENVKVLLQIGVDLHCLSHPLLPPRIAKVHIDIVNLLTYEDIKTGGTPLHWAKSRVAIDALVELGCNLDAQNSLQQTALHVMILRGRFDCVMALLSYNASTSVSDKDGNTALHLAAAKGHIPTVQAILAFSGRLSLLNNAGESVRHLAANAPTKAKLVFILSAVGAPRCVDKLKNCNPYCASGGGNDGQPPENFTKLANLRARFQLDELLTNAGNSAAVNSKAGLKLLCLDGGGIRGLVLIQMLKAIEEECGVPINHVFDWIFGTSTGGILALALAKGKTVSDCLGLYFRLKGRVFVGSRPYDSENLEAFLRLEFGDSCFMSDLHSPPKVAVTAVLADRFPADLHLFRNYEPPQDIIGIEDHGPYQRICKPAEQLVWRAARSTGAAPTYFRAMGRFIDGGMIANNPTLDALTEVSEYNTALKAVNRDQEAKDVGLVLSLGTGRFPLEEVAALDLFRPENIMDAARLALNISNFGKILVESATMSDGRVIDRARAWCGSIGAAYFRLSPTLTAEVNLDETKDEVLVNMLWETMVYINRKKGDLKSFCRRLIVKSPEIRCAVAQKSSCDMSP